MKETISLLKHIREKAEKARAKKIVTVVQKEEEYLEEGIEEVYTLGFFKRAKIAH